MTLWGARRRARSVEGTQAALISPDEWRRRRPPSVTSTSATSADGSVLRFLHNWSWDMVAMASPDSVVDLLSGTALQAGEPIHLGPWDVRVVVERTDTVTTDTGEDTHP